MGDIKPIQNEFAGIEGNYGIINQGTGYAVVNILTKEMKAHNISSYLDALKTAEHLAKRDKAEEVINLEPTPVTAMPSDFLDELDMATVVSMVTYFERYAPDIILRYHQDHNATYDEAEAICRKCLEIASQFKKVKTKEDLKNVIQSVEILKSKVSRYQHHHYKYRWTTHLQKDVLDKLTPILTQLDFNDHDPSLLEIEPSAYDHQIRGKINNIKKYSNSNSKFYGKLLNWYSDGFWHYGIGLSDEYIFDLGENLDVFHKKDREIKFVQKIRHFSPDKTIQRLIYALCCFQDWHYGFLGWNCEHYSRLVATNVAISYQVKKSPLAFLNHGGYHPTAVQKFTDYLNHLGLSELTLFEN